MIGSEDFMTAQSAFLAEKVGQLFMVGFEGQEVTPELADWMTSYHWGGVIVFGRNVESPAQLLRLTQGLQSLTQSHSQWPLLMAVDQEGGRVARLKAPFTAFPSAARVGQARSARLAYDVGYLMAQELRAVGINMDMAPVLDVLTNPANTVIGDRAFGSHPDWVGRFGAAFVRGMRAAGVLTVGKHFPGHGDTVLDSHVARPVCERTVAQLNACELLPFREGIAAGIDAIMTAHVIYPAWDSEQPATLSPTILTGILRDQMGFAGAIVTDDLGMAAVAETGPWEEIPLRALHAGVDLLLICHDRPRQESAYTRVLNAVQQGELPEALLNRAMARIQALKFGLNRLLQGAPAPASLACIGSAPHRALVEIICQQSAQMAVERRPDGG
jgi:beta-N-acetylhexosaminidase